MLHSRPQIHVALTVAAVGTGKHMSFDGRLLHGAPAEAAVWDTPKVFAVLYVPSTTVMMLAADCMVCAHGAGQQKEGACPTCYIPGEHMAQSPAALDTASGGGSWAWPVAALHRAVPYSCCCALEATVKTLALLDTTDVSFAHACFYLC